MNTLIFAIWFFIPAGVANAAPIIAAKIPGLSKLTAPLDFNIMFRGKRFFGEHKTWRGLIVGIIAAIAVVYLQQLINQQVFLEFIPVNAEEYLFNSPVLLGFLFGFGALMGDAIESFFKRQKPIAPGKAWFPFDQIDYIIGGCLATAALVQLSYAQYLTVFIVWFLMHLLFSYIGYLLNLKRSAI